MIDVDELLSRVRALDRDPSPRNRIDSYPASVMLVEDLMASLLALEASVWDRVGGILQTPPNGLSEDEYRRRVIEMLQVQTDAERRT